jgi:His-Xaa-Ser system protein HxsD
MSTNPEPDLGHDGIALRLVDGALHLSLHADAYSLAALQKTAYGLANRCSVVVGPAADGGIPVTLHFRPDTTEAQARQVALQFLRDVVDQELRERLAEETRAMRSLLLAHAFSRTNLIRRD